jgi:hypothetical protein
MNAVPLTLLLGVWLASSGPGREEWPGFLTWINQPLAQVTAAGELGLGERDSLPGVTSLSTLVRLALADEHRGVLTPWLAEGGSQPSREDGSRGFKSEAAVVPGNQNQVLGPARQARHGKGVRRNPGLRKPRWVLPHIPAVRLKVPGV